MDKCLGIEGESTGELSCVGISSENSLGCIVVLPPGLLTKPFVSCLHY